MFRSQLYILLVLQLFNIIQIHSQSIMCPILQVEKINIIGNEKTKSWVIEKECDLHLGDTISINRIGNKLEDIKFKLSRLVNFSNVAVKYKIYFEDKCLVIIDIIVDENWLLFPSIIAEIADPNINIWWVDQRHSFKRINYGIKILHYNLTGRSDKLKIKFHTGYTDKYEISYDFPYFFNNKNFNLSLGLLYSSYKEIDVKTLANKFVFLQNDHDNLLIRREFNLKYYYRDETNWTHSLEVRLYHNKIKESLASLYPEYFLASKYKFDKFKINLNSIYSSFDIGIRPQRGIKFKTTIETIVAPFEKGNNYIFFSQEFINAKAINRNVSLLSRINCQESLNRIKPAYYIYRTLDNNRHIVPGYEYYILNGTDYVIVDQAIRIFILDYKKSFFKLLAKEPRIKIKSELDLRFNTTGAYFNEPYYYQTNSLINKFIYSVTCGLDLTINNGIMLQMNYSLNHLAKGGFFVHLNSAL